MYFGNKWNLSSDNDQIDRAFTVSSFFFVIYTLNFGNIWTVRGVGKLLKAPFSSTFDLIVRSQNYLTLHDSNNFIYHWLNFLVLFLDIYTLNFSNIWTVQGVGKLLKAPFSSTFDSIVRSQNYLTLHDSKASPLFSVFQIHTGSSFRITFDPYKRFFLTM